jgi:hypothetical protein
MKHHNKNEKDNVIASAILFTLATILVIAGAATAITITTLKSADATIFEYQVGFPNDEISTSPLLYLVRTST